MYDEKSVMAIGRLIISLVVYGWRWRTSSVDAFPIEIPMSEFETRFFLLCLLNRLECGSEHREQLNCTWLVPEIINYCLELSSENDQPLPAWVNEISASNLRKLHCRRSVIIHSLQTASNNRSPNRSINIACSWVRAFMACVIQHYCNIFYRINNWFDVNDPKIDPSAWFICMSKRRLPFVCRFCFLSQCAPESAMKTKNAATFI